MATFTPNLNLEQQGSTERASLVVLNSNLGKIDTFAGTVNGEIGKLSTPPAYSADCNDIDETCVVYVTDSATNSPGSWYILSTTVFDTSNAISQIAISVVDGKMKKRAKNSNGWTKWTLQDLQSIVVTSVSNLQETLLTKAQAMGPEGIENIKIIFNGSNEGVFANGNYYCGWIAINSAGTNWLYFSGVLKGLFGSDTVEFTYSNGTWSFNKLVASKWEIVTPTINSTKIVSGSVSCVKSDGIAYVQLYNVVFASSGSLSQCITGLPQAVVGGDGTFIGTSAASTAQISAAGDTWYFDPNTTYLNAITGSTYGSGHWASFMYPCV